jgi:hypothetical protein
MDKLTVDGVPRVAALRDTTARRTVSVKRSLDRRIRERMAKEGITYSGIVEEGLRLVFGQTEKLG